MLKLLKKLFGRGCRTLIFDENVFIGNIVFHLAILSPIFSFQLELTTPMYLRPFLCTVRKMHVMKQLLGAPNSLVGRNSKFSLIRSKPKSVCVYLGSESLTLSPSMYVQITQAQLDVPIPYCSSLEHNTSMSCTANLNPRSWDEGCLGVVDY